MATKQLWSSDDGATPDVYEKVETMATDLQPYQAPNPLTMLEAAIERGIEPDQLGKLMDLCERHERNQAAAAFGTAISKFQKLCPTVHKGRTATINSTKGSYKYNYAGFDDVMAQAGPHLSDCGIAISFSTEANDKGIRVTTRVRVGIHAEDYTLDVPIPAMNVNDTQRYGAALSYAKRYGICAALNIVCSDDVDDDAANVGLDPINGEQEMVLLDLIRDKGVNREKFLKWLGVESVDAIPARDFQKAFEALRSKPDATH